MKREAQRVLAVVHEESFESLTVVPKAYSQIQGHSSLNLVFRRPGSSFMAVCTVPYQKLLPCIQANVWERVHLTSMSTSGWADEF